MQVQSQSKLQEQAEVYELPFSKTGFFGKIPIDYESESAVLSKFLGPAPSIESYKSKAVDKLKSYAHRKALVQVLKAQNSPATEAQQHSLNLLENSEALTVTTGHQVCFMGGPLYFIYKALHTIKLAQKLTSELSEHSVVPIFWLATEDHDYDEIAQVTVFGKKEALSKPENKIPVGRIPLSEFEQLKKFALSFFEGWTELAELEKWLNHAWESAETLTDFTRNLLQTWFGKYGLLVLDADHPTLKQCFATTIRQEIEDGFVKSAVETTAEQFPDAYKVQAHPRPCNFFLFKDGLRYRLEKEGSNFSLVGTEVKYTQEALLDLLDSSPELFSPNVLTRPLYQECILPNIAYIGGGGELAYWIQLKEVFGRANIPFPQVVLRNSFQLVDAGVAKKIENLGIAPEELFLEESILVNQFLADGDVDNALDFDGATPDKMAFYAQIKEKVASVDPTLVASVEGQEKSLEKFLEGLQKKLRKRLKERQQVEVNQISNIKSRLFPNNGLQERSENVLHYIAKNGFEFFDFILAESGDIKSTFKLVYLP